MSGFLIKFTKGADKRIILKGLLLEEVSLNGCKIYNFFINLDIYKYFQWIQYLKKKSAIMGALLDGKGGGGNTK